MNRTKFQAFMDLVYGGIKSVNVQKGNDYSGDKDAFLNFKRNAVTLDVKPELVWAVYFNKHIDAIMTYVREGGGTKRTHRRPYRRRNIVPVPTTGHDKRKGT